MKRHETERDRARRELLDYFDNVPDNQHDVNEIIAIARGEMTSDGARIKGKCGHIHPEGDAR